MSQRRWYLTLSQAGVWVLFNPLNTLGWWWINLYELLLSVLSHQKLPSLQKALVLVSFLCTHKFEWSKLSVKVQAESDNHSSFLTSVFDTLWPGPNCLNLTCCFRAKSWLWIIFFINITRFRASYMRPLFTWQIPFPWVISSGASQYSVSGWPMKLRQNQQTAMVFEWPLFLVAATVSFFVPSAWLEAELEMDNILYIIAEPATTLRKNWLWYHIYINIYIIAQPIFS